MKLYNTYAARYRGRMIVAAPPVLTRLRNHRGAWLVLVAVAFFKLASSTICLLDGPWVTPANAPATATIFVGLDSQGVDGSADSGCLLGETASCHCACAHAMTVPATAWVAFKPIDAGNDFPGTVAWLSPITSRSMLRPPIA